MQILKDKGEDAKKIGIMVASHNEDTVRFAIEKMKEIGISPEDKVICFGQLLGMCDYITMPLGKERYCLLIFIKLNTMSEFKWCLLIERQFMSCCVLIERLDLQTRFLVFSTTFIKKIFVFFFCLFHKLRSSWILGLQVYPIWSSA